MSGGERFFDGRCGDACRVHSVPAASGRVSRYRCGGSAVAACAERARREPTGRDRRHPGYPVDTRPPKDFFSDQLLKTLGKEATATVVCRLQGLTDVFPDHKEPDTFYDASCEVVEVLRGPIDAIALGKTLNFVWQVERGNRMPPPQSELLVYLKARKEPLDGPPPLKWVALDTGVMRYTPALQEKIRKTFQEEK